MNNLYKDNQLKLEPNHYAFGTGLKNDCGLKMVFAYDKDLVSSKLKVSQSFSGWHNLVHGGIISAILDEAMGQVVLYKYKTVVFTKEIKVKFLRPIKINEEILVKANVIKTDKEDEAKAEGFIYKDDNLLCAKSYGEFKIFLIQNESDKDKILKKLDIKGAK